MIFSMTKDINRLIQNPIGRLKRIVFCLCIAMAAFFSSCTNDACKESMYTSMQVLLYSKGTPTQATSLDTLSIIAMRNGLPVDTIYKDSSGVSVWELPLDYTSGISKFYIRSNSLRDTLVVRHTNTDEFVSAECGSRVVSHIDTVYFSHGHFEDSISVVNHTVNGAYNGKNVKIYLD